MSEDLDILGLCGATLKGTFALVQAVARGGFGVVYRGLHLSLQKEIAVKIFSPLTVPEAGVEREALSHFFQEVKILSTLEHSATVRPYDCGTIDLPERGEVPWVALEWIEGHTLGEILRTHPRRVWSPREAMALMRPVMEALAEAHARGIAHRDVAPNNIIVSESAQGHRVRLIDFGIACIRPPYEEPTEIDAPTGSLLIAHSPRYPAPEQVLQQRTGTWTDVHALGLILYHLLTGYFPYPNSASDPEHGACALRRPTPGLVDVDVGAWEPVLARAVAIDPRDRFVTAGELLAALEQTLEAAVPAHDEFEVALPDNWRVVEVAPTAVPVLLNTPERTVILYPTLLNADDVRAGTEIPVNAGLSCKLVLQRYAEVSMALTVVGHPGERPGLYSNPQGVGSRLTRAMIDPGAEKVVYCGLRGYGLREIVCYAAQTRLAERLSIDVPRLNLTVCFTSAVREFILLQMDEPELPRTHLACVGID